MPATDSTCACLTISKCMYFLLFSQVHQLLGRWAQRCGSNADDALRLRDQLDMLARNALAIIRHAPCSPATARAVYWA